MNFDLEQTIVILTRTPETIRTMLHELQTEWTHRNYGPDTWSAHEIVGHLIWGERTDWLPRLHHILELGEAKPFESFDRNGHSSICEKNSTSELIEIFASERKTNLENLSSLSLSQADFKKTGQHPALGTVTVSELLAAWSVHDLNHIAQINKAMAYQYQLEVGPWENYLSILSPPNPR